MFSNDVSTRNHAGWDMQGHKVVNLQNSDSTNDDQTAATVKFVNDHFLHKKINPTLTSSTFSNEVVAVSLDLSGNQLFGLPYPLIESDTVPLSLLKRHM